MRNVFTPIYTYTPDERSAEAGHFFVILIRAFLTCFQQPFRAADFRHQSEE